MVSSALSNIANLPPKKTLRIPELLVREVIDGVPFFYKGYKSVLNKTKKIEDICT
jgi:hypothetical protein